MEEAQMSEGPAYIIVELLEVKDADGLSEYVAAIAEQIRSRGGRTFARGFDVVEGSPQGQMRVILEFPSVQAFKDWQEAPEYQELKALRQRSAVITLIGTDRVTPVYDSKKKRERPPSKRNQGE
jgi:uncharacterized protein (DUF1330 family)